MPLDFLLAKLKMGFCAVHVTVHGTFEVRFHEYP